MNTEITLTDKINALVGKMNDLEDRINALANKINAHPLLPLIDIDIRWEDTGEVVHNLLVSQYDGIDETIDDTIFYYGMTWTEVQDCIKNKTGPLGSEFIILDACLVEP